MTESGSVGEVSECKRRRGRVHWALVATAASLAIVFVIVALLAPPSLALADEQGHARVRRVRAAARQKPSIMLAARPKNRDVVRATTTQASSQGTSSSSPSTAASSEPTSSELAPAAAVEQALDSEASDDYEDIEPRKGSGAGSPPPAQPASGDDAMRAPKSKKPSGAPKKQKSSKKKPTTTTTSSTTTEPPEEEQGEEEQEEEVQEGQEEPDSGTDQEVTSTAKPKKKTTAAKEEEEEEGGPRGAAREEKNEKYEAKSGGTPESSGNRSDAQLAAGGWHQRHRAKVKPLVVLPFIKPKNASVCAPEAFLEFPPDLIGDRWRSRGLVLVHLLVVCYMFYALALVCERYFMPSLEEFAQRLNLSEDVAGATLMSAGSSAPELFTAILGVFVAKGDVGTGAIVGSAVFNILFVIGVCAFVSTTSAQLQWWPVLRDSLYYTFTVLVLILIIYDERITASESLVMIVLYGVYILIMANNERFKEVATRLLASCPLTASLLAGVGGGAGSVDGPDDVFGSASSGGGTGPGLSLSSLFGRQKQVVITEMSAGSKQTDIEDDSMYLAALLVIMKHKRLFGSTLRFQAAARYVIVKLQHRRQARQKQSALKQTSEVDYFEAKPLRDTCGPGAAAGAPNQRAKMEAYAHGGAMSKNKFSIVSRDDYEMWNMPPGEGENYYLWLARIPVNFVLHYTIPDCSLYPDKFVYTFIISIAWTAVFSYVMVWMVTLIGYTFSIPDSVMGVTFLAAGTSVPDCYSSIHAARNGMADMAVSNSIGSNVFDILIGLGVPWFIQSAIYPGIVATVNSRGVIYSVVLLFFSLIVTIHLLNKYQWTLQPRLGLALLIAYGLFLVLTCMLEFNLLGQVSPPPCPVPANLA